MKVPAASVVPLWPPETKSTPPTALSTKYQVLIIGVVRPEPLDEVEEVELLEDEVLLEELELPVEEELLDEVELLEEEVSSSSELASVLVELPSDPAHAAKSSEKRNREMIRIRDLVM